MIAAVSGAMAQPGSSITGSTGRYFFKMPDLRDEVWQAIGKAAPTLIGICRALHDQGRRGRTVAIRQDAENGKIGVGLKHIARSMGINPTTVRRHLTILERLGLVVVMRPGILHVTDPATGKIASKQKGRTPPAVVYLTIVESHGRPAKKGAKSAPSAAVMGCKARPIAGSVRVQNAPPSKDANTIEAETAGSMSRPADSAGEAGRHSAAGAGHEQVIVTTITPDEPGAVVTVENALSGPATPSVPSGPQEPTGEAPAKPANVTTQQHNAPPDANDNPADGSGMDASLGSMAEELARLTGKTAARLEENASAIDRLRGKIDSLPPAKKRRTKRLGKKAKAMADAEKQLLDLVKQKQAQQTKEQAAATKAHYRDQYRAEKAMAVA